MTAQMYRSNRRLRSQGTFKYGNHGSTRRPPVIFEQRNGPRIFRRLVIIVAVIGSIAPDASAVPIAFDNFGSGDTYDNAGRWFGTIGPNSTKIATSFAPTLSGQIAGLTAAIVTNFSGAGSFTLSIRLGSSGPTGSLLWQSLISDTLLSPFGSVLDLSISGPMVTAGTTYWVVAETDAPTFYSWQANNTVDNGPIASNLNDAGWLVSNGSRRSALRVTLVPEPETAGLVALGMAWLSILRRRRLRRERVSRLAA